MAAQVIRGAAAAVVAEICLYGTSAIGAGYIAAAPDGQGGLWMSGTGDPVQGRPFTEAIFQAVEDLKVAGITSGLVQVFHPGGEYVSTIDLDQPIPTYGSLTSKPAPVFVLAPEPGTYAEYAAAFPNCPDPRN
jgi:hypothetical protein